MKNGHLHIVTPVGEAKKFLKLSSGEDQVADMFAIQDIKDPPLQFCSTLKDLDLSTHCTCPRGQRAQTRAPQILCT